MQNPLMAFDLKVTGLFPSKRGNPPTFVIPSLRAGRWALAFVVGMMAVPSGHTWAWFALVPMCYYTWKALETLSDYIGRRVYLQAGTPFDELPERLTQRLPRSYKMSVNR